MTEVIGKSISLFRGMPEASFFPEMPQVFNRCASSLLITVIAMDVCLTVMSGMPFFGGIPQPFNLGYCLLHYPLVTLRRAHRGVSGAQQLNRLYLLYLRRGYVEFAR
jgi:hypothetical protein